MREREAAEVYERSRRFASIGITHVGHLLDGTGKLMSWAQFRAVAVGPDRRGCAPCEREEYESLCASLPPAWKRTLADARDARAQGRTLTDQLHGMAPHADASVWCTQACNGTRYVTRAAGGDRTVFEWREGGELRAWPRAI